LSQLKNSRQADLIIDPLVFSLPRRGGISRVWASLLPRLMASDLTVSFTVGDGFNHRPGEDALSALRQFDTAHKIPAGVRRFVPYAGSGGMFFPTYYRPCIPGIRNVQLAHDCIKELHFPLPKAVMSRIRRRALYAKATGIIAVSEVTRSDIQSLYGSAVGSRVRVIHNPVDHEYILGCAEKSDCSDDLKRIEAWVSGRPFAVYVGQRWGYKNFGEVRHLLAALPGHTVVAIGAPATQQEMDLARAVDDRILFAGPASDTTLFGLLKRSHFLFWPSRIEGFGLPIVESLILGTPVLALPTQINLEISLGLISTFESGSPSSIRSAVSGLQRIGPDDSTRAELIKRYAPDRVGAAYVSAIKDFREQA